MPLPCFCSPLQCGLCLSEEAGYPGKAADHRCHIWHNEQTHERLRMSHREKDEGLLYVPASIKSKKTASVICIQNKVSLKRSKKLSNNRQHSFTNCSCCIFNPQPHRVVSPFIPFTLALLFTTKGEGLSIRHMQRKLRDICIAVNNQRADGKQRALKTKQAPSWLRETAGRHESAIL